MSLPDWLARPMTAARFANCAVSNWILSPLAEKPLMLYPVLSLALFFSTALVWEGPSRLR